MDQISSLVDFTNRFGHPVSLLKAEIPVGCQDFILNCQTDKGMTLVLHSESKKNLYFQIESVLSDCHRLYPDVDVRVAYVSSGVISDVMRIVSGTDIVSHDLIEDRTSDASSLFKRIITWAAEKSASDVHFEVMNGRCQVRARINGYVTKCPLVENIKPDELIAAIRSAYNVLSDAGSRTSSSDLPESDVASAAIDIQLAIHGTTQNYKLRMEWSPDFGGATAVFRLNNMGKFVAYAPWRGDYQRLRETLRTFGYFDDQVETILDAASSKKGIFIVGGPVGSGKTTLIYTILVFTSSDDVITRSVEDPIEAELPGVRMVAAGTGINLASLTQEEKIAQYGKYLRSALRMDMDQLLIGEVRSREMALIMLDVNQSAHAGFCTMHFGSVFDAVERLSGHSMGLERDVICQEGFFRLTMVQDLLPTLCDCKLTASEAAIDRSYLDTIQAVLDQFDSDLSMEQIRFRNALGCSKCQDTTPGILGRTAVAELMEDSAAIMNALRSRDKEVAKRIFRIGREPLDIPKGQGRTTYENGLHKVLTGIVDPRDLEVVMKSFKKVLREKELEGVTIR